MKAGSLKHNPCVQLLYHINIGFKKFLTDRVVVVFSRSEFSTRKCNLSFIANKMEEKNIIDSSEEPNLLPSFTQEDRDPVYISTEF